MPLYNYKCTSCDNTSEMLLKMSDPDPTLCPECGQDSPNNMVKQVSRASFVLKGTGWYETDFKDKKKEPKKKPESTERASTSTKKQESTPSKEDKTPTKKPAASSKSEPAKKS